MNLSPGARLGPYEILSPLGAGGMGEVWRARDTRLARDVAVKVLPQEFFEGEERRQRFEREAKLLASLNHPNIAAVYSFEEIPGSSPLLVMELVEGEALSRRMKAGPIPMHEALSIGRDIASALEAAHAKGIVHRDLKPGNVMISADGRVKLLDFGLAKSFESIDPEDVSHSPTLTDAGTATGVILGTAAYMSPEQARGQHVDARTDVWAFGVVLWELLAGKRLFRGQSTTDTLAAVLREPVDFRALSLTTPRAIRDLLARCLERDPGKRLLDIGAARRELEKVTTGGARRRPPVVTLAAAAGVLILITFGGLFLQRRTGAPTSRASIAPSIAVLPFKNLSDDKNQEYFSDGLAEELMGLLTKVTELHVAGRTSSFAFKGKTEDLSSIGRKLHVATVLEGSVRRAGDQLRVSTQLVNVADGYQIWAETYDRKLTDVFAVQDEIAGAVVSALKVKLLSQDRQVTSQHKTSNPEAYNQYLLGLQFHNRGNKEGFRRAVEAYEKAIALDPNYAAAYAELAVAEYSLADTTDTVAEIVAGKVRALSAAEKAVTLDSALPEAYSARGYVRLWVNWDWPGARADLERTLSLDPGETRAHGTYGQLLSSLGNLPEAIGAFRKRIELDPLSSGAWSALGYRLFAHDESASARKALERALEITPELERANFILGLTWLLQGNPDMALLQIRRESDPVYRQTGLALVKCDGGRVKEADEALDALISRDAHDAAYQVAEVYAWCGESDSAFAWLDRAYSQRDGGMAEIKFDPLLAKLRGDPRYSALVKKMNLPVSP